MTHFDDDDDLAAAHGSAAGSKHGHKVDRPRIEAAVREILLAIGEDPDRGGLLDTPKRVAKLTPRSSQGCTSTLRMSSPPRSTSTMKSLSS